MRTIILIAGVAAAITGSPPGMAATIDASSAITRVTVYADGALVQRTLNADLPAGDTVMIVRGLPAALDPTSLRVEGQGDIALTIVSIDSRIAPGDARPAVDADLERRLEALRTEHETVAGSIEAADGQKAAILRYAQASPERLSDDGHALDPDKWPAAWRAIGVGLAQVNETLRGLRDRARQLADEIAALDRARPQPPRPGTPKRDVTIAVSGEAPAKAVFSLTYQVAGAGWTPAYDATLVTTGDKPRLAIARRAAVQQRTGEDWADVSLALSTVRLRRGTAAPDLSAQTLTLADPFAEAEAARLSAARAAPPAMAMAKTDRLARMPDAAPAPVPAMPAIATLDAGAYDATFTVPGTVAVPPDGTTKSFALGGHDVEAAMGARATPALDPTAYLEATFANTDDAPLLAGDVALRRDGVFIGKGRMPLTPPGDKTRLGFGADDRIKVTRTPVARRDNDNAFGPNRSETQDFRTSVKNLHAFPVRVAVIDRIPVSENTAVVVTPLDTNTPPTDKTVDDQRGVSGWTYDYKPGETRDVRLGWRVRWPADRDLRRSEAPRSEPSRP